MIFVFKRIMCFVLAILIPIALFPFSAFAFADSALAYEAVAALLDAYGMYYGVGSVYDVTSPSGVGSSFEMVWNDFNSFRQNNSQSTYDIIDVYHYMQSEVDDQPVVSEFTHSSGNFAGFYIDSESAEIFDNFWNWLLSGPAQMQIVDNQFQWNYDQQDVIISPTVSDFSSLPVVPVVSGTVSKDSIISLGFVCINTTSGNPSQYLAVSSSDVYFAYVLSSSTYYPYVVSSSPFTSYRAPYYDSYQSSGFASLHNGLYGGRVASYNSSVYSLVSSYPVFNSEADLYSFFNSGVISGSIDLVPYSSDPDYDPSSDPPPPITLPVVSALDYSPSAVEIVSDIPWDDDDYGDVFPLPDASFESLVQDITDSISANDFALLADPNPVDPDPVPPASEIFSPLLPVSPPSFDFNFAGIWHYVVTWVQSLGSWFSTMFSVWAALPYAMVVPVYATAVVVIVLGVYKRFFM